MIATPTHDRCTVCDRPHASVHSDDGCHRRRIDRSRPGHVLLTARNVMAQWLADSQDADRQCRARLVDWRLRALDAEALVELLRLRVTELEIESAERHGIMVRR